MVKTKFYLYCEDMVSVLIGPFNHFEDAVAHQKLIKSWGGADEGGCIISEDLAKTFKAMNTHTPEADILLHDACDALSDDCLHGLEYDEREAQLVNDLAKLAIYGTVNLLESDEAMEEEAPPDRGQVLADTNEAWFDNQVEERVSFQDKIEARAAELIAVIRTFHKWKPADEASK